MKYVIIGNSVAAVACIEGIRSVDQKGEITVISNENRHCYGRPLISYYLLGRIKKENIDYRPRDFYRKNEVNALLGRTATAIEPERKTVVLEDGEEIPYDKLLVASGSRPFVPFTEGLESVPDRFTFMTFDDAEALEKKLDGEKRVLIVGAGLIGLKCAEGILHRVKKVTVVDLADRILPSVLDRESSAVVEASLANRGIEFLLNDSAARFSGKRAFLKSGKELEFDLLVVAVGVRANTELVAAAGGRTGRGIVVDERMRTTIDDVYAAGDCAEGYDQSTGTNRVLALLPNAYFQGKCAGVNMAGGESSFLGGIPMNSVGFFDCHIATAGIYEGECVSHTDGKKLKKLFIKDGKLVGFILIGDIARAGIYTALIRSGTPLSEIDRERMAEKPQLLALSEESRRKIFTQAV